MESGRNRFLCLVLCTALLMTCTGIAAAEGAAVETGLFAGLTFSGTEYDGFLIPTPEGWSKQSTGGDQSKIFIRSGSVAGGSKMTMEVSWYLSESPYHYAEDPETAEAEIRDDYNKIAKGVKNGEMEFIDLDGHPAGLMTYFMNDNKGKFAAHCGRVAYVRNNRYLLFFVYIMGKDPEKTPRITMDDLKILAERIGYDAEQAPFTAAKATFSVKGKNDVHEITAGKPLQLEAVFDFPDIINKKEKNDGVTWTVFNAETGADEPLASVSANGQLNVDRKLDAPLELEAVGTSVAYGTEARCRIQAYPIVTGVSVEPAQLFFYVGSDDPQTVKAVLEPASMPPVGIAWKPAKEGVVEIAPVEDGVVSIRPLTAGKTTVQVTEPGGKRTKFDVSVVPPVESVELTVKGNAKPGATVNISAALAPKEAGNKNLEWALDVGEEIAVINANGQVRISKDAVSGTKITVTCTATGAPEPITAAVEIEIQ